MNSELNITYSPSVASIVLYVRCLCLSTSNGPSKFGRLSFALSCLFGNLPFRHSAPPSSRVRVSSPFVSDHPNVLDIVSLLGTFRHVIMLAPRPNRRGIRVDTRCSKNSVLLQTQQRALSLMQALGIRLTPKAHQWGHLVHRCVLLVIKTRMLTLSCGGCWGTCEPWESALRADGETMVARK